MEFMIHLLLFSLLKYFSIYIQTAKNDDDCQNVYFFINIPNPLLVIKFSSRKNMFHMCIYRKTGQFRKSRDTMITVTEHLLCLNGHKFYSCNKNTQEFVENKKIV